MLTTYAVLDVNLPILEGMDYEHSFSEPFSSQERQGFDSLIDIPLLGQGTLQSNSSNFGYLSQNHEPQQSPLVRSVNGGHVDPSPKKYTIL